MKKTTTANMILDKRYLKVNSEHPVKLRVIHDRQPRYFPTEYSFSEADWNKMKGKKPGPLQSKLDELTKKEHEAREIINGMNIFSFDLFKKKYTNNYDTNTLSGAFSAYIDSMKAKRPATASNYNCALVSLESHKKGLLLSDITVSFLKKYSEWMESEGRSQTTIGMYLRALRAVLNQSELPAELYPFGTGGFSIPQGASNKRWLPEKVLYDLYHYDGIYLEAKDYWFFSYFGNGMNFKDLVKLRYSDIDPDTDTISYYRSKTIRTKKKQEKIKIDYTDDMKKIVLKYGQHGVYSDSDDYIFPVLANKKNPKKLSPAAREMQLKDQFIHVINNDLKKIAGELKIKPFTTYSSRHSWSSNQMNAGLSIAAIGKMLGHANSQTTESYLGSLNVKTIRQASKNAVAFKKQKTA